MLREHKVEVSLRTVERAVGKHRALLRAQALATVRFETPPGKQAQADFGEMWVTIGGERTKVHLCVITLAWSRRIFVRAFRHERQGNWLETMEDSFRAFGGVPEEMLIDNARALVTTHDVATGEVVFSDRFAGFMAYWGVRPRACAPYRAQTKGKDERGVGYVKWNAIAGRTFETWEALEAWVYSVPPAPVDTDRHDKPPRRTGARGRRCRKRMSGASRMAASVVGLVVEACRTGTTRCSRCCRARPRSTKWRGVWACARRRSWGGERLRWRA